ncbi:unnamed protein product [Taenia asiatica]|uniref:Uncharacterized protein n=1 Tax=Taenia asiatica TaxID=60517 RepID=A0A158R7Z3_TAEAS|nr:unnamed protein product [Taenia asiatica]
MVVVSYLNFRFELSSDRPCFILVPLDNVTELTEEESQNADSFNVIESGDISRADHHRKSTSDAVPIDVVVIVKGGNKTAQTPRLLPSFEYRASEHLYFAGQSKACCSESICGHDSLSCSYLTALSGEGGETSSTVTGADLSTAPRWRRESVGRPEKTQVVWPASLRQSHLHEKPHFPSRLSANLLVRAWVCPLLHLYHPSVQLHSSSQHPITPSSPTPLQSACKDTDSLWKGWKASCDNGGGAAAETSNISSDSDNGSIEWMGIRNRKIDTSSCSTSCVRPRYRRRAAKQTLAEVTPLVSALIGRIDNRLDPTPMPGCKFGCLLWLTCKSGWN